MKKQILAYIVDFIQEYKEIFVLLILSLVLGSFRLSECMLWIDESFSLGIAQQPLSRIWSLEAHPNGFYFNRAPPMYETILSFLWQIKGENLLLGRWFSIGCFTATIGLIYLITSYIINKQAGLIAAFLGTFNYGYIFYAKSIRWYSLLNVLCLASFYLFFKALAGPKEKKYMLFLMMVNTLILYTAYFGMFLIAMEIGCLLFVFKFSQIKSKLIWMAGSFVLFIPWMKHALRDVTNEPVLKAQTFAGMDFFSILSSRLELGIFQQKFLGVAYSLIVIGTLGYTLVNRKYKKAQYDMLLCVALCAIIPIFLINLLTLKAAGDYSRARYFLCFIFPAFICTGWLIRKASKIIGITIFCAITICSIFTIYKHLSADLVELSLARLPMLVEEARNFPVAEEDKVVIEIEDALFVPLFVRYFYGSEYVKQVSFPTTSQRQLSQLAVQKGNQYQLFYNAAGIVSAHRLGSIPEFLKADWLFLIYSDWFTAEWGQPYRIKYEKKLLEYDLKKNLQLIAIFRKGGFTLEIYRVMK